MKFITGLLAAVIGFGVYAAGEQDMRPRVCIDTKKIVNKTDNPKANFSGLIDRLNHELVQCGMYRVMNMQDLESTLVDNEKFAVAADDGGNKTNIKTPGFYIRMTVTRYGWGERQITDIIHGSGIRRKLTANVELILTLVDMQTAETIKSCNIICEETDGKTYHAGERVQVDRRDRNNIRFDKMNNDTEQILQAANQKACQKIIMELVKVTPFSVMDVNGNEIMIDAPASIAPNGTLFDIFKPGRAIRNKRTGKVTRRETKLCTIKITSAGEDSCTGQIVTIYVQEAVQPDYIVRPSTEKSAAPAPAAAPAVPTAAAPF